MADNILDADDNILDADRQRESPQAAKRMRLDSDHVRLEDGTSAAPSSLDDAEVFVDPHHPNKLLEGLNRLRLHRVLCDVTLCCEGQEVPCHRSVLASFSPYFEAMFTSGMRESTQDRVTISGLEPQMIGLLVNYAYTSEVSISADNVQALLAASDLLEVPSVREACCEYMKRHVETTNCVEFYCSADDHSCEMLKKHSLDHILEHFRVIYQQEAFLSLSVERLTEVLSSDHLNVPEEDMVFEAAMLWLDKCPTRKQSFGQVLEHIRLPLITPSYLHTVAESLDVVKEQQDCQRFISEAKGEQPCSDTARPRRTTVEVIVMLGNTRTSKGGVGKVESFDPLTKQRRSLGRLPIKDPMKYAVCASGSSLYLTRGSHDYGETCRIDVWRYDAHRNSWLKMGPMHEPRYCYGLVALDGCVFAVGGLGSEKSEDSMEQYDPRTDTWQLMESVGVEEYYNWYSCNVVGLDGELYFIGDVTRAEDDEHVFKYNPKTSVWTQVAPMQIPRDAAAACVLNGKIYVTGGESCINSIQTIEYTMECFNPQTNQWTMCASMQMKRDWPNKAAMVVTDGKIYALGERSGGGYDNYVRNIECYCEETDTWTTVAEIADAHKAIGCVSLKLRRDHGQPIDDDEEEDVLSFLTADTSLTY